MKKIFLAISLGSLSSGPAIAEIVYNASSSDNCCIRCLGNRLGTDTVDTTGWNMNASYCEPTQPYSASNPISTNSSFPLTKTQMCIPSYAYDIGNGYRMQISTYSTCKINETYKTIEANTVINSAYIDCAPGYYGTANSSGTAGCTKCPSATYGAIATCDGGNNSTFTCGSNSLKVTSGYSIGCHTCPSNATCNGGTTFACNKGYYKSGTYACTKCPASGVTGEAGQTSITMCFLYVLQDDNANKTWYDTTGNFDINSNCFYSTTDNPPEVIGWRYK